MARFNTEDAVPASVPVDPSSSLTDSEEEEQVKFPFREAVGSLLYAALVSRPEIAYSVGVVSRFMEKPGQQHVNAVKRIMRYLKATKDKGIVYNSNDPLQGYTDADFAQDYTRRSTTGFVFVMGGGPVTWKSQRQKKVTLSTTEAEDAAACEGAREVVWIRQLLSDIGVSEEKATVLKIDNQSALRLIQNSEVHARTKHFDVQLHFVRESCKSKIIDVRYVRSERQLADIFTKPLSRNKFNENVENLNVSEIYSEWEC